jgi:hypothetical protein
MRPIGQVQVTKIFGRVLNRPFPYMRKVVFFVHLAMET